MLWTAHVTMDDEHSMLVGMCNNGNYMAEMRAQDLGAVDAITLTSAAVDENYVGMAQNGTHCRHYSLYGRTVGATYPCIERQRKEGERQNDDGEEEPAAKVAHKNLLWLGFKKYGSPDTIRLQTGSNAKKVSGGTVLFAVSVRSTVGLAGSPPP